ncbi:alpha-copaene synthase-like [Rutidosis leptorrhynchoides]|uniref:alpha-copaene synthase-like n=1 Tax=Rutidosis leptorrhynchoides TaxID=125765 RepID=UPI003A9904AC
MEEPKEQVRRMIIDPTMDTNEKMSLIYFVYRLGLTYIFLEDIECQLDKLFKELQLQDHYREADLFTISVHFQVFRNHGYKLSCDVFNKFKDCNSGTFKEVIVADVRGMLSFYESSQLRIRGESILDEAFAFTKAQLEKVEKTLDGNLACQVKHALEKPFHRGHPMVRSRLCLLHYEDECSRHDPLVTLAKIHFNYLQLQQKEELRIVSKWWNDMNFKVITPYVRDRVPEIYVWMLAIYIEPYYSQARIITTKTVLLLLVLDDTFDAYATIEEVRLLTAAINRWELSAMGDLPEYMKPFYEILLNEYAGFNDEILAQKGTTYFIDASKQAFQEMARCYLIEAEWRNNKEVPSYEEYMKIGLTTSTKDLLSKSALIGMGKIVTKEAYVWYQSHPKILKASETISRLRDDVMSFEYERQRAPAATSVEAYIKTFGVSESIAIEELNKKVEDAHKDINEGSLKPRELPMDLIAPIVKLAHMIDVVYQYDDGLTFPDKTLKKIITLLLVDSVPM